MQKEKDFLYRCNVFEYNQDFGIFSEKVAVPYWFFKF